MRSSQGRGGREGEGRGGGKGREEGPHELCLGGLQIPSAGSGNSMLAKPLAACTYLSSIVSELYDA